MQSMFSLTIFLSVIFLSCQEDKDSEVKFHDPQPEKIFLRHLVDFVEVDGTDPMVVEGTVIGGIANVATGVELEFVGETPQVLRVKDLTPDRRYQLLDKVTLIKEFDVKNTPYYTGKSQVGAGGTFSVYIISGDSETLIAGESETLADARIANTMVGGGKRLRYKFRSNSDDRLFEGKIGKKLNYFEWVDLLKIDSLIDYLRGTCQTEWKQVAKSSETLKEGESLSLEKEEHTALNFMLEQSYECQVQDNALHLRGGNDSISISIEYLAWLVIRIKNDGIGINSKYVRANTSRDVLNVPLEKEASTQNAEEAASTQNTEE